MNVSCHSLAFYKCHSIILHWISGLVVYTPVTAKRSLLNYSSWDLSHCWVVSWHTCHSANGSLNYSPPDLSLCAGLLGCTPVAQEVHLITLYWISQHAGLSAGTPFTLQMDLLTTLHQISHYVLACWVAHQLLKKST